MEESKIIIIHGLNDLNKEGILEKTGNINEDVLHTICLLEYAEKTYPNIEIFKKLDYRFSPQTVSYFFTQLNDIIFLNTTKNIKKYGKTGILLMPNQITDKQEDILKQFAKQNNDFNVNILYNLRIIDGILDGMEIDKDFGGTFEERLNNYLRKNKTK